MYFTAAGLLLIVALANGQTLSDCNTDTGRCNGKNIAINATMSYTFPQNENIYFACSADAYGAVSIAGGCQQCQNENLYFVPRCDKCVIEKNKDKCEKAPETTGAPAQDCTGIDDNDDVCPTRSNSTYKFAKNPQKFFRCFMGERSKFCGRCPSDESYSNQCQRCAKVVADIEDANCDVNVNVTLGRGFCANNNACAGKMDGDFELNADSTDYYSCSGGICTERKCHGRLKYSAACGQCRNSYVATGNEENCKKGVKDVANAAPIYQCPSPTWCNGKESGIYADAAYPGMYYTCRKTVSFTTSYDCIAAMKCPAGLNYIEAEEKCM